VVLPHQVPRRSRSGDAGASPNPGPLPPRALSPTSRRCRSGSPATRPARGEGGGVAFLLSSLVGWGGRGRSSPAAWLAGAGRPPRQREVQPPDPAGPWPDLGPARRGLFVWLGIEAGAGRRRWQLRMGRMVATRRARGGGGWPALRARRGRPRGAGFGGGGRRGLVVLWCWQHCPAALGPSRASSSSSMEGVGGGRAAQIYGVVACSRWVAAWAAMARCWVAVLGAYLA